MHLIKIYYSYEIEIDSYFDFEKNVKTIATVKVGRLICNLQEKYL